MLTGVPVGWLRTQALPGKSTHTRMSRHQCYRADPPATQQISAGELTGRQVRRALVETLPETDAAASYEFITGPLLEQPPPRWQAVASAA